MRQLWKHFDIIERDLNLDECGIHQFEIGENYEYNAYQNFVLHYVAAGEGQFSVNENTYALSEGDGFIVRKGCNVSYMSIDNSPMKNYWVGLSGNLFEEYIQRTQLTKADKFKFDNNSNIPKIIKDICHATLELENQEVNDLFYLGKIYQLLYYVMLEFIELKPYSDYELNYDNYAEIAQHYIYNNFMNKLTISEVAEYIGISRSHLYRCFKDAYNISPQQYITNLRMETSSSLLQDTNDKIKDIAEKVGFPNQLQFSSRFKEYFDVSPSRYRQLKKTMGYRLK